MKFINRQKVIYGEGPEIVVTSEGGAFAWEGGTKELSEMPRMCSSLVGLQTDVHMCKISLSSTLEIHAFHCTCV